MKIKTALELMKARYEAYKNGDIKFIKETHDPETAINVSWEDTEEWAKNSKWLGLEILSVVDGKEDDEKGIVEFKAFYEENNEKRVHHEKSLFVKNNGKWYYKKWLPIQGTIEKNEKIGRNDICPCGSGKKYKKCCGK